MYTLYGFQYSGAAAVEIALERVGVPFRRVNAASWEPSSALAELEAVNPLKQIPTLVLPDGSVLTESAAILIHLGLTFPQSNLLPEDAGLRAQVIRGLVFIAANCYSAISIIDYPERWIENAEEDIKARLRQGTRERLHLHWHIFADVFAHHPYLSGAEPGALDYLAVVASKWSGTRASLRTHRPEFYAILERIEVHPSVAPVIARYFPARESSPASTP